MHENGVQTGWEVWDLPSARMLRAIGQEETGGGGTVALSPDGSRIAVEQGDRIAVYPVEGGNPVMWLRNGRRLGDSTTWSPDGRRLAMVRHAGCLSCDRTPSSSEVRIVDVETGAAIDGGSFAPLPANIVLRVQGWRTPEQLVVQVGRGVEIFTMGEAVPRRMLTLPEGVTTVEIATSRLADPPRAAEPPTYGPPNHFLWLMLAICGIPLLLAVIGWWLVRRFRTAKRS
ncbi:PD40 domain-containing protein [Micromonospora sp. STR1s_5]|nr:PD40 domain-containing protein [Micromonospora sp. STR1s_5]